LRRILLIAIALCVVATEAWATCPFTAKDAAASSTNILSADDGSGNCIMYGRTVGSTGAAIFPNTAALADATANPTLSGIGAYLMGFNGTTWDRVDTVGTGTLKSDMSSIAGTATAVNTGAASAGTQRVVLSTDSALAANQSVNIAQMNGVTTTMGNGASGTGVQRVTLASDSTGIVQPVSAATGGMSVFSKQVANNTTSFAVDGSAGTLYAIAAYNNSATKVYVKLYNTAQGSVTCGTPTPVDRHLIPADSGSNGSGFIWSVPLGVAYSTAITACVTAGYADNDTTAPPATSVLVSFYYR
jgi:hypothetical protein